MYAIVLPLAALLSSRPVSPAWRSYSALPWHCTLSLPYDILSCWGRATQIVPEFPGVSPFDPDEIAACSRRYAQEKSHLFCSYIFVQRPLSKSLSRGNRKSGLDPPLWGDSKVSMTCNGHILCFAAKNRVMYRERKIRA